MSKLKHYKLPQLTKKLKTEFDKLVNHEAVRDAFEDGQKNYATDKNC